MLSYHFWHWPLDKDSLPLYESRLSSFHQDLKAAGPEGFLASACYRSASPSWLPGQINAYLDLYLLEDSAALDALNEAAVSNGCDATHHAVAALSSGGAAGLYTHKAGPMGFLETVSSHWFGKPEGWDYPRLYRAMDPLMNDGEGALWARRMVLGPSPEFCLFSATRIAPSEGIQAEIVRLTRFFPAPGG